MHKNTSLAFGITLIALGVLALIGNVLLKIYGGFFITGMRAWPLIVIGIGLLFCIPPFLYNRQRGLGGLFIPGIPVLVTGVILFITSVTGQWDLWAILWPFEVLGVALGFILAAIFMQVIWLYIPASIIGMNGLVLIFCALTGAWDAWAVLWTIEPLAIGLPLLLIGLIRGIDGIKLAGIILCGFAGLAFAGMSAALVTNWWITQWIGPLLVVSLGALIIASSMIKRPGKDNNTPPSKEQG
ncbi:MAG: hypothetical protein JXA13_08960 [Anaerolineales bacterium]|nr:hypothetical protein [Anaerolineales bacterium]